MKKFIALVLVLTMALSLAACGGSGSSSKKDGEVAVFWYTFGDTYLSSVRAALNTALTNAGATVLDHLPHGSFFHATSGSVSMSFKDRLALIPFESLVGLTLTLATLLCSCLF